MSRFAAPRAVLLVGSSPGRLSQRASRSSPRICISKTFPLTLLRDLATITSGCRIRSSWSTQPARRRLRSILAACFTKATASS